MVVRIAHLSDTHLGARPREGVKQNVWAVEMRTRLLENDFYERFKQIFEEIAVLDEPVDVVIHSGDLYDSPWEGNPSQPPVVAQETALSVLKEFTQSTGIPVVVIEGNHGLYRSLDVSLLDSLGMSIDGLDVATQVDLKSAISSGKPLKFVYENLEVFCFPFIEMSVLESANLVDKFNDWITTYQSPNPKCISVAVTHGMDLDRTLFSSIFDMGYDYIALGHDHHQRKYSKNAWYAGSPERWRFDEVKHEKGYLLIDIEKAKPPEIKPQHISFRRLVSDIEIDIQKDDMVTNVIDRVKNMLEEQQLKTTWNSETAARIRLVFTGESSRFSGLDLTMGLETLRMDLLSQDSDYNVAQLVWSTKRLDQKRDSAAYPEIESEYLIEDPGEDFRAYLETLEIDERYDVDLLTSVAVRALKYAVGREEGKLTLDTLSEEDSAD